MTEADRIFDLFPDYIKEYIYSHSWQELRSVQIAAARTLLQTNNNLLLTSSTASGKTEAAFFPILSRLHEDPSSTIGVLYIAPLKSLINDQFERLQELLDQSAVKVTHWHGDVGQSQKTGLLQKPEGILQITPESLESMLINRPNDIIRLFGDLRYIVIDEIHTLMGSDRGNQIICQISRICRIINRSPIRIGLSATLGDTKMAAEWLSAGSGRATDVPIIEEGKIKWRIGLEHFYLQNDYADQGNTEKNGKTDPRAPVDAGYEYIYECVKNKKAPIILRLSVLFSVHS